MQVDEFFISLSVDGTKGAETLRGFSKQVGDLKLTSLAAVGAIAAIGSIWKSSILSSNSAALALSVFHSNTGLATIELQRYQKAAAIAGISTEEVAGSVTGLAENLAMMRLTGQGIMPYQVLGIDPRKGVWDVLKQVHERSKTVDPATMSALAGSMGISPGMMYMLRKSDAEVNRFIAEGEKGQQTPEQLLNSMKRLEDMKSVGAEIKGVANSIADAATGPLHTLKPLFNDIADILREHPAAGSIGAILGAILGTSLIGPMAGVPVGMGVGGVAGAGFQAGGGMSAFMKDATAGVAGAGIGTMMAGPAGTAPGFLLGALSEAVRQMVAQSGGGVTPTINANIRHTADENTYDAGLVKGMELGSAAMRLSLTTQK
jgi:hypothetical protein